MQRDLGRLSSHQFDVLVVGGGIHGALAAWDATLRGLSVALIERGDFGSATSQNSLKIVHGGLRYLQDGNLARIRTMAQERTTWMRIAPHLVHPLDCLMPTRNKISRNRLVMGAALMMNDLLSFDRNRGMDTEKHLKGGRILTKQELSQLLPGYDTDSSTGAAVWHDAQIYSTERLLLEFVLSAKEEGAEVANYVEATGFLQTESRVAGVSARDVFTGQVFEIRARAVINCAGAWAEGLLEKINIPTGYATSIAMNLIVDQIWPNVAAGLPSRPSRGRPSQILFFVPWRGKTMIGTWHLPWTKAPSEFRMTEAVIQDFIGEINSAYPSLGLSFETVRHVTWGFLPVHKKDAQREPVRLTRDGMVLDHEATDGVPGLISILGVKYTTARAVAEKAVDLAVRRLAVKAKKCQTDTAPVHGGRIRDFKAFLTGALENTPHGIKEGIVEHLAYTYGSNHRRFIDEMIENPGLGECIDSSLPVTAAEVVHAVHHEMAWTLADVIQRRTELGAAGLPSDPVLQKCAKIIGGELGWSPARQQQEIEFVLQLYPIKQTEVVAA